MNNFDFKLRMPIETTRNNETITKVCVEDVSRILSRVQTSINKANKDVKNLFKSVRKRYASSFQDSEGYLVIGRGYSQPCHGDQFDEKIGNNIAFMKAKLNANFKKRSLLISAYNKSYARKVRTREYTTRNRRYRKSNFLFSQNIQMPEPRRHRRPQLPEGYWRTDGTA